MSANGDTDLPRRLLGQPVSNVQWVPLDQVEANDYNPNKVAARELALLYHSIDYDGWTQPIVTVHDVARGKFIVVDGFHRWLVVKRHPDMRERFGGHVPIVVIDKSPQERMAATVRHNRARGKHSVKGMSQIVFGMLDSGMDDEAICRELGMEADELIRLKHITGFARLFGDVEYRRAWETRRQIQVRRDWLEAQDAAAE